jgi:hypothetical protein
MLRGVMFNICMFACTCVHMCVCVRHVVNHVHILAACRLFQWQLFEREKNLLRDILINSLQD